MPSLSHITVFCGSSESNDPEYLNYSEALGTSLAKSNIGIIYGGAKVGIMGALAKGALNEGGKVIGIIPYFLETKEVAHDGLTQMITVQTMHERKLKMNEMADGFIILPGGYGTMEEFFEVLTWGQLGLHQKPIGILNVGGYYDALIHLFETMLAKELIGKNHMKMILISSSIDDLMEKMRTYTPPKMKNWITDKEKT